MFVTKYYCKHTLMDKHSYRIIILPLSAKVFIIFTSVRKKAMMHIFSIMLIYFLTHLHTAL